MKAAIIGYGRMGREIEEILRRRGHEVGPVIDRENREEFDSVHFASVDVALEFTQPDTAADNIRRCADLGVGVVCGTTGWGERFEQTADYVRRKGGALFYASNYCLGVNLLFDINRRLASLMRPFAQYDVRIEEVHHVHKKDAPSGTAITLAEGIEAGIGRKTGWDRGEAANPGRIGIASVREGEIAGIHRVVYESDDDRLLLEHTIKNRRTLAEGAVIAAEFLCGKQGVFTMDELLKENGNG